MFRSARSAFDFSRNAPIWTAKKAGSGTAGVPIIVISTWATPGPIRSISFAAACDRSIDAALHERTAIDNPHIHRFIVAEIPHANDGLERQGAVSRDHRFHIVDFTIRGRASVIGMSVPTRETPLCRADWRGGFGKGSRLHYRSCRRGDDDLFFAAGPDNDCAREDADQAAVHGS